MNHDEGQQEPQESQNQQFPELTGGPKEASFLQIAIWMALGALIVLIVWGRNNTVNVNDPSLVKVKEIQGLFEKYYVEEIDPIKFTEDLLVGGVAKASDPYSRYFDKKQVEWLKSRTAGKFGGIGIRFEARKNLQLQIYEIIIVSVIDNTPAQKAGLKTGDIIVAVSSTFSIDSRVVVDDRPFTESVDLIRGEPGTKVKLWVLRGNEIKEFTLTREIIKINSVYSKKIKDGVGYVKINSFDQNTDIDFGKEVGKLLAGGTKSLIIDVRNNPGGLLPVVVSTILYFQDDFSLPIMYTKRHNGDYKPYGNLSFDQLKSIIKKEKLRDPNSIINPYTDLKVVVLINGYSASASELLAGWFKEEFCAPVIGEKSFGKGCIQDILILRDRSQLVMTTQYYFVGKNKLPIHGIGIEPTIVVKNTKTKDRQLAKAIEVATDLLK